MAKKEKNDFKRLNCNIPTPIMDRIEEYCKERGLPKTQGVVVLINSALDYDFTLKSVPSLLVAAQELKEEMIKKQ